MRVGLVWLLLGMLTTTTYEGSLGPFNPTNRYDIPLAAGEEVLIVAEAEDGNLDPLLTLYDAADNVLLINDDYGEDNYDAGISFTASEAGVYVVEVGRPDLSVGAYRLHVYRGDDIYDLPRMALSGDIEIYDTPHFRIHYTQSGSDAAELPFVKSVADTMERLWVFQVEQLGWPAPPSDGSLGGDGRYDVYLRDLLDADGFGLSGYISPRTIVGDNPNTPIQEQNSTTSFMVLDNDYIEVSQRATSPREAMVSTASHEFHHSIQSGYDGLEPHLWYWEATATWMELQTLPKTGDALIRADSNFEYPEICFGGELYPGDVYLVYGEWLFIQSLVDAHGEGIIYELWDDVAQYDGFDALEQTLARYDETILDALQRYRIRNLIRDYGQSPFFSATVWLEGTIDEVGEWPAAADGVQELGANYYEFSPQPGIYDVRLNRQNLALWYVGMRDGKADAFALERGGTVDTRPYDVGYLIAFNTDYRNNLDICSFQDYTVNVTASELTAPTPTLAEMDAANFIRLR